MEKDIFNTMIPPDEFQKWLIMMFLMGVMSAVVSQF